MKLRRTLTACLTLLATAPFAVSAANADSGSSHAGPATHAVARSAAAGHAGMTWVATQQSTQGYVHVGTDATTNAYQGDTPAYAVLPVLCLSVNYAPVPAGVTPDFYNGWGRGVVGLTLPVPGTTLTSRAAADALCASSFGTGWREAEFHDGYYGTNLSASGGWAFWANGAVPSTTRFWVAINDQLANPWN